MSNTIADSFKIIAEIEILCEMTSQIESVCLNLYLVELFLIKFGMQFCYANSDHAAIFAKDVVWWEGDCLKIDHYIGLEFVPGFKCGSPC